MKPLATAPVALAAALLLSACGAPAADSASAPAATSRPGPVLPRPGTVPPRSAAETTAAETAPPETEPPRPATPTSERRADPVPAKLVGSWVSTGGGDAEMIYEFDADGTYRYAGVLMQQRPSGMFSFEVGATGTARFTRSRLTLRPERGTQTLKDLDAADGGWQRPISTEKQVQRWSLSGGRLRITDADGVTVTYRRQ